MGMNPFALLLVSHFLGDAVVTSSGLSRRKRDESLSGQVLALGLHVSIHASIAGLLLALAGMPWVLAATWVFVLHFLIDFARCRTEIRMLGYGKIFMSRPEIISWLFKKGKGNPGVDKGKLRPWLLLNILDQGAHVVSLYFIGEILKSG